MIFAALVAFFFVDWASLKLYGHSTTMLKVGFGLGLIIPLIIIISIFNIISFHLAYDSVSPLINGIKTIADGDFTIRLKSTRESYITPIYEDFNKMARQLQQTNILRNDFINSYSHEFKTPIASINGFANLLLNQKLTGTEQKEYLKIIADESARLAALANNTLFLSRLDSLQIISGKKPYSLDEQLRHCAILLSSEWNKKHINFSGEMDEVTYIGDKELMQHLWLNLMSNAIKFTPENVDITVSLSHGKDTITVKIADTGIGMDPETAGHIFEKYYQGNAGRQQSGLGLGLNIVRKIVELCGGTISVESRIDEGSVFTVKLPL
jgi:signal transduction histidine kinase